ncbi:fructose-1,6-bisphosphatase class 3 [Companilactobacillus sp. RD055328]|uniref:fructose-1,6-bisphosphatase n=1 Tax=Companilactobacillus sp. RD055328 TaxID=2916634 RepID=UPI001FC85A03|nr:fructose-1,6-bisphosphatase [Companilactobacillus sp. RD055328]GKQ43289.1 fructose-1,6-bisphosphatase class 3 [Companilactobacillus sp. RD055328]
MKKLTTKVMHSYFPNKNDIKTEIINLSAILNLPKSTEEFMSDIHGEYNAFSHIFRNGSGNIAQKINDRFNGELTDKQKKELAFLIYYPSEMVTRKKRQLDNLDELRKWYERNFYLVIELLKVVSRKYTRSKVRKALAEDFIYITEELLYTNEKDINKDEYYNQIIENLIDLSIADDFIVETSHSIQRLVVDRLHIIGDIYDRGPHPDYIVDKLSSLSQVDVQWGNHDILWLGGASGSPLCICNLIRISARYNNLSIIEDSYGINLRHLSMFADKNYTPNPAFESKSDGQTVISSELEQTNKIQQAIAIMQFKLEGRAINRRPEFGMEDRKLLDKMNEDFSQITIDGETYPITNGCFQTIDKNNPYELTAEEQEIMDGLVKSFTTSNKLRKHMDFLIEKGSMYLKNNDNLLIHGCVPVNNQGEFESLVIDGKKYAGKELFEFLEDNLRASYQEPECVNDLATDLMWYLWTGSLSPLFGKRAMKTFERYFIDNKDIQKEHKNPYYKLRHEEWFIDKILTEFGLDSDKGHVINGHTPVKKGHSPIMANGKMFVIDGGMSKPYQKTTGIGGYTLLSNSYGFQLVTHEPFTTRDDAIKNLSDIVSTKKVVAQVDHRMKVADTDIGSQLKEEIKELKEVLDQY